MRRLKGEMTLEDLKLRRAIAGQQQFTMEQALELLIRWNGAAEAFLLEGDEERARLCFDIANIVEDNIL